MNQIVWASHSPLFHTTKLMESPNKSSKSIISTDQPDDYYESFITDKSVGKITNNVMDIPRIFGKNPNFILGKSDPHSVLYQLSISKRIQNDAYPCNSTVAKRRHVHNICERKRREHISEGFYLLQQRIPKKYPHYKMSKLEVLKTSVKHLSELQKSTKDLETEVNQLLNSYIYSCKQSGNPPSTEEIEKLLSDAESDVVL